jgi:hypothetical protein
MTLSSTVNRVNYAGNGSTTAFAFSYLFYADGDLTVILVNDSTGVETTKTITTHYTVSGAGSGSGGTVTMVTAPASGETLVIIREVDLTQGLDLVENDPFPSELVEQQFDQSVMMAQQISTTVARSFKLSDGDTTGVDTTLPTPVALKTFRWNAGLTALEQTDDPAVSATAAAASAAAALVSENAAAADLVLTNADVVSTNADVVSTNADVVTTAAAVVQAEAAAAAAAGGVKVSANDTTPGDLETKILPGTGLLATTQNDGANETRTLTVDVGTGNNQIVQLNGSAQLPAVDGSLLTGLATTDLTDVHTRIMQNAFQIAVNGGLSVRNMADGVVDVFTDETGVDTVTSTNETYDATGDYYHNPATGYGSDIIPVMTTNTAPSGVASDSGTASDAWQAFNDTIDNYQWLYGSPRWIQYAFDSGVTKTPTRVRLSATNAGPNIGGAPSSWNLVASNTGDFSGEETTLHSVAGEAAWSTSEVRTYTFTNTTAYRYFRLNITANQGHPTFSGVAEFELNESAGAPDMTLVSNATTALAQPDSAFLVLHHEPVDAVTLNTDVKAYASRDGGTTYTQGTLSKATDLSGNEDILIADVDFTGDPAGTSMKWKVETLNNTVQRLRAIANQWS